MNPKSFYSNVDNIIYNNSYSDEDKISKWNLLKKEINELNLHPEKFKRNLNRLSKNYL